MHKILQTDKQTLQVGIIAHAKGIAIGVQGMGGGDLKLTNVTKNDTQPVKASLSIV